MNFFKKTFTLRLPLWLLLLLETAAVILIATAIILQTSIPKTLQLRTLRPGKVASAQLTYSPVRAPVQKVTLSKEDISAAVKLLNQVRLSGKPYSMQFIGGGPKSITFSLTNGTVLEFGIISSGNYFYYVDGEYYYICSDGKFVGEGLPGEGADRHPGDLDLYDQWEQLYESLCNKYSE